MKGNQFHGPQVGTEWILTRDRTCWWGLSGNETMSMVGADGTNQTVNASMLGNFIGCGSSKGLLGNGFGLNIEKDSGVIITESS